MSWRNATACGLLAGMLLAASLHVAGAQGPSADDTARFLAGMAVKADSALQPLAQDERWQRHAGAFDSTFADLERQQLGKIRAWSSAYLNGARPTMLYFFSGPDFPYAEAFFPDATTYVLSGLEAVGQVPDLTTLPIDEVARALTNIEVSLSSFLTASYFITVKMDVDLNNGPVNGVLPLLYVFLARSGKVIQDVTFVDLDRSGQLQSSGGPRSRNPARGVKIVFAGADGRAKILYYFAADLADTKSGSSALLQFCRRLGRADSLLKSASYLLHESKFSRVRGFVLESSATIVQDDSGVPAASFDRTKWLLAAFGRYNRPNGIFGKYYQPMLTELFRQHPPAAIDFGIGYQARYGGSNLLLATRATVALNVTREGEKSPARR